MKTEIKPEELRIGNLVFDETMNTTVVESIIPEHNRKRYAIPLTEEKLIQMGFEREDKGGVSTQFSIGTNPITHDHMIQLIWIKSSKDDSLGDYPFYKNGLHRIKYVHQLQNLYFSLTQTELIK